MRGLFTKSVFFLIVFLVVGVLKPAAIQAQCFHLGQDFDCKGLPEGTSSVSFNPDGTINLSNGGVVPGNFFNTPFVAPVPTVPTIVIPTNQQIVLPSNFFPTTLDGQNALTAFSHPFDLLDDATLKILNANLAYQLATFPLGSSSAGFTFDLDGRPFRGPFAARAFDEMKREDEAKQKLMDEMKKGLTFFLEMNGFGKHDIKADYESFEKKSKPLRYGAGYRGAEVAEIGYPGEYAQDTMLEGNLTMNLGLRYLPIFSDVSGGPSGSIIIDISDADRLAAILEKTVDELDRETVPVPELPWAELSPPSQSEPHKYDPSQVM